MRQAIMLSPSDPHYYVSFAALCLENDSFQIGIDVVNAGLSRIPDSASLYMARGLLYAELSQYGKAEIDFKMAQKLNPTQGSSSYALGLTEIQADHPDQAIEIIHNKLKSSPSDPLLYYLLAKIYLSQGAVKGSEQLNQAIHSALLAVRFKSDFVQARDILATAYLRNGEVKLAIDQCHKALLYDPSDQSAIYHLIIASRVSGNKAELKTLAQQLERLQQAARNKEDQRKRYRLVESEPPNAQQE
jgi:tetratricopeptide (TPR) repeat protein